MRRATVFLPSNLLLGLSPRVSVLGNKSFSASCRHIPVFQDQRRSNCHLHRICAHTSHPFQIRTSSWTVTVSFVRRVAIRWYKKETILYLQRFTQKFCIFKEWRTCKESGYNKPDWWGLYRKERTKAFGKWVTPIGTKALKAINQKISEEKKKKEGDPKSVVEKLKEEALALSPVEPIKEKSPLQHRIEEDAFAGRKPIHIS